MEAEDRRRAAGRQRNDHGAERQADGGAGRRLTETSGALHGQPVAWRRGAGTRRPWPACRMVITSVWFETVSARRS
jgi:hypothetical protein